MPLSQRRQPHLQNHDLPWWPNFLRGDQNFRRQFSEQSSQVKWAWNKQNVNTSVTKSLPRHASWCHLLHLGHAQCPEQDLLVCRGLHYAIPSCNRWRQGACLAGPELAWQMALSARLAPWCHLLQSGLAWFKPGQTNQACSEQAQSGTRGLVWAAPEPCKPG